MNTLLHRDGDDDLDDRTGHKDREITLGTSLILGIFLALAVLCAVFFGFGYSMGHKAVVTNPPVTAESSGNTFGGFKPAPGNPVGSVLNGSPQPAQPLSASYAPPPAVTGASVLSKKPQAPADQSPDDLVVGDSPSAATPPVRSAPTVSVPAASLPMPSTVPGGSALVQIAAVSHQEDADLLVTTLRRRGYNVAVHSEPQDKLLHVQVGPFASHKDADTMRQRLLADGFNAIVKDAR